MRTLKLLAIITIAIVAHEYGHYRAMRNCHVPVKEFAIGIGHKVWETTTETGMIVSVRMVPLGGFTDPDTDALARLSPVQLIYVFVNGMLMNAFLAFLILALVRSFRDDGSFIGTSFVKRVPAVLRPTFSSFMDSFVLWIATPFIILYLMVFRTRRFFASTMTPLALIAGVPIGSDEKESAEDAKSRPRSGQLVSFLVFLAMISTAIAGFNMLPLIPLDGGRVAALVVAMLFGEDAASVYGSISFVLFGVLVVSLFLSDILKIVRRKRT